MFKFYSKIVGVNYLFQSLARVINELELVVSEKEHVRDITYSLALTLCTDLHHRMLKRAKRAFLTSTWRYVQ
jgi:hypothetical protein